jgi:hypothetical protein
VRRGVRREEVVAWVMERFGFAPSLREKVALRYHQLETGQLDARRADPKLVDGLADFLHARAKDLLAWKPRPVHARAAFFRESDEHRLPSLTAPPAIEPPDKVDSLFGVVHERN